MTAFFRTSAATFDSPLLIVCLVIFSLAPHLSIASLPVEPDIYDRCSNGLIARLQDTRASHERLEQLTGFDDATPLISNTAQARIHERVQTASQSSSALSRLDDIGMDRMYHLTFINREACLGALDSLTDIPSVEYVFANGPGILTQASGMYTEEHLDELWGLHLMDVPELWQRSRGEGVTVAVVDTGVDVNHPALKDRIAVDESGNIIGRNLRDQTDDVTDTDGHGTAVAGIVNAVAPDATLMPVKASYSGVLFAVANGADIINLSFGVDLGQISESEFESLRTFVTDILETAELAGVTVVKAAGNASRFVGDAIPSSVPYGITVASVQQQIQSSAIVSDAYEPSQFSNHGPGVDVYAPGGDLFQDIPGTGILTTLSGDARESKDAHADLFVAGEYFVYITGTSAAAPHVAGLAALIKSLHPEWSPEQVRQALRITALDITGPTAQYYGEGLANVQAADVSSPPSARIRYPLTGTTLSGTTEVLGITAIAAGTGDAKVTSTDLSGDPSDYLTLNQQAAMTSEGGILATLDSRNLSEGDHLLAVTVTDANGQQATDSVLVTVDDIGVSIDSDKLLAPGDTIDVNIRTSAGSSSHDFRGYTLYIRSVAENTDFEVVQQASTRPHDGEDGISMSLDGFLSGEYELRLDVQYGTNTKRETTRFTVADDVLWQITSLNRSPIALEVADINGNGTMEVIFVEGGSLTSPSRVHVVDASGNPLSGWPKESYFIDSGLVVADVDNSGTLEIVFSGAESAHASHRDIHAYRFTGESLPGWPVRSQGALYRSYLRAGDVTGNGKPELVYMTNDGSDVQAFVEVFSADGTLLEGWPRTFTTEPSGRTQRDYSVVLADLEGAGYQDIIIKSGRLRRNTKVWRVDHAGDTRAGFPVHLPASTQCAGQTTVPANILTGDLNGNGTRDIVVSNFLISPRGEVTELCTQNAEGRYLYPTPQWTSTLADITGDGTPEHVYLSRRGFAPEVDAEVKARYDVNSFFGRYSLHAVDQDGQDVGNYHQMELLIDANVYNRHLTAPVVADLNRDGFSEIITVARRVQAWDINGELAPYLDKESCPVTHGHQFRIKVRDIDNNGSQNVIAYGCERIVVWEIEAGVNPVVPERLPERVTERVSGAASTARISGGVRVNNGMIVTDRITAPSDIVISASIEPEEGHIGRSANVIVVVMVDGVMLAVGQSGEMVPLDETDIQSFTTIDELAARNDLTLFSGAISESDRGEFNIFVGYLLEGNSSTGEVIYNAEPLRLLVE